MDIEKKGICIDTVRIDENKKATVELVSFEGSGGIHFISWRRRRNKRNCDEKKISWTVVNCPIQIVEERTSYTPRNFMYILTWSGCG